jgi:hypothetical protein
MEAQGFDPVLLKFNADQLRVPAGNGSDSGRWTSNGAGRSDGIHGNIILVSSDENEKDRGYNERRERGEASPKEDVDHGRGTRSFPSGL